MSEKMLSLADLDLSKPCETGFEFEYIADSTGAASGVFITVLGGHSEKVKAWVRGSLNRMRQRDSLAQKRGKDDVRTVEEDEQFALENAATRIISWRGISDECNFRNAVTLCSVNSEIRDQVVRHSEDLKNFTMGK